MLVTAQGGRKQKGTRCPGATQVIQVHHHRIPGNPFPYVGVPCLFPIQISQSRLGPGTIRMNQIAEIGVTAQNIR